MVSIIGAGKVGSTSAFNLLRNRICSDVVLIDIAEDLAKGEALDMMQAAPAIGFDGEITGTNDFSKMEGSEVVVIVAGAGRKPGMSRFDLIDVNSKIVKSIVKEIVRYAPNCKIMVVTNPVDIMTYIAYKESGFDKNRVFGMGNTLDIYRFKSCIAAELNISSEDVHGLVIGEHGDSMVPLVDYTTVSGIPIKYLLEKKKIDEIVTLTKTAGSDIIKLKGSTIYAPGVVIASLVDAVLRDRNRVTSASTFLVGEYGLSNISIGVPVILGKNGVKRILELKLSLETYEEFKESASIIKNTISELKS